MNLNRKAYLDMLAWSEGTSTNKYTKNNGYDVIVNGIGGEPKIFTDYSTHPNVLVTLNKSGLKSTAAGRYQLLYRWYGPYSKMLGLSDFSPDSQDAIALQQIKERKSIQLIDDGDIEKAINLCSNIWASLPGNNYGQKQHKVEDLISMFLKFGGVLK